MPALQAGKMESMSSQYSLGWSTPVPLRTVQSATFPSTKTSFHAYTHIHTSLNPPTQGRRNYFLKPFTRPRSQPYPNITTSSHPVMTISVSETITEIRAEHFTSKYKTDSLIVRRGFPVRLQTTSSTLTITLVPAHPSKTTNFKYSFNLSVGKEWKGWSLEQLGDGKTLKLHIPTNAIVGLYTIQDDNTKVSMAVLFNPFHTEDTVYMPNQNERNEYVLNEMGRIWRGSFPSYSGMPWNFSQFKLFVLLAAIDLIDSLHIDHRHDPVYVSRHLSAMMNSGDDDNGVLVGKWYGDYNDGVAPTAWTGSADILKQYWEKRRPVKYGQCWVYSGVFTSVLRALGIPANSVSNFDSAHEDTKPYSRVIERYYNSNGEIQEEKSGDSIWNFHVWNMAWMQRPDLAEKAKEHGMDYNGWQVLDGTPQEESMGLFQLGPGPLNAIKYGYEVDFDTDFVIAEVNADLVYYWEDGDTGKYLPRDKYERHIGKAISTKAVGDDTRNDITLLYKFKEGSAEERASFNNRPTGALQPIPQDVQDVQFRTELPSEVKVGSPVNVLIKVTNNTSADVTVHVNCEYSATAYTGRPLEKFGKYSEDLVVESSKGRDVVVSVPAETYEPRLRDGMQTIYFNCSALVKESGQVWSQENLVRLNPDDVLLARAPATVDLGRPAVVTAIISNPTHMKLTGVLLRAEGEGLLKLNTINVRDLEVGETVEVGVDLDPTDIGDKLLVMTLDTVQLMDVARSVHIEVQPRSRTSDLFSFLWRGAESENMDELTNVGSR